MFATLSYKVKKGDHVFIFGTCLGAFIWSVLCGMQCLANATAGEFLGGAPACFFQSFYHYLGIAIQYLCFFWFAFRNYASVVRHQRITYCTAWKHFSVILITLFIACGILGGLSSVELKSSGNFCLFSNGSLITLVILIPMCFVGFLFVMLVYARVYLFVRRNQRKIQIGESVLQSAKLRKYQLRVVNALFFHALGFSVFAALPILIAHLVFYLRPNTVGLEHFYGYGASLWSLISPLYLAWDRSYLFQDWICVSRLNSCLFPSVRGLHNPIANDWTLAKCLACKEGVNKLHLFLQQEYSAENLLFLMAVQEFRNRCNVVPPCTPPPPRALTFHDAPSTSPSHPTLTFHDAPCVVEESFPNLVRTSLAEKTVAAPMVIWVETKKPPFPVAQTQLLREAQHIFETFIDYNGTMQVNLPAEMVMDIREQLAAESGTNGGSEFELGLRLDRLGKVFDNAFEEIAWLLQQDKWNRFSDSLKSHRNRRIGSSVQSSSIYDVDVLVESHEVS
eukprot:gb/GEZN01004775.1/.p1 GENE.gb/GEZN01004775.1/~~gb/GEZN01004775.1/.p1  ORF type:complete len:557 (+),score=39.87 gb/GEZN01004775.1/:156-1673(+)